VIETTDTDEKDDVGPADLTESDADSSSTDTEQEARRGYALAQVRQYPDTALRMKALMADARGVGLAAPQVGVLQRLLVYQASAEAEAIALVNPVVVEKSEEVEVGEEGCLSLGRATINVDIERAVSLTVKAKTPSGEPLEVEATGLEARVIQHELDHLDGILIIDHATPEQRRDAMAKLRPRPGSQG
jgi:peptide deformylase